MASHTDIIKRFDTIIQSMRAGGVNNPIDYIEQISYFLFLKLLDEKEEQREQVAKLTGKDYDGVFAGKNEKFRFRNWAHTLNGDELRIFIEAEVFPFIKNLKSLREEERKYFHNAHLKIYEPSTLKGVVESIASMDFSTLDSIDKGDLYEHMLAQISKSGKNGQFRTPRHIIDVMTQIVNPDIMETVYDPSVGTAGFIISAFQHILNQYSDKNTMKKKTDDRGEEYQLGTGDRMTSTQRDFLYQKTFYGYDIDAHMVRFSIMNMILHGFSEGTNIRIKDTLGKNTDEQDKARQYDIILANPPFSGSIDKSRIDEDDFPVVSNSTEVLFLGHMIDKLRDGGRAAIIVPEGILFKTNKDYKAIRKYMIENCKMQGVISLPSGVFQPYSGVKTNILIFQKGGTTDKVWFYDMQADGYDLGAQRRPIKDSDIPDILETWEKIQGGEEIENERTWFASKVEIENNEWVLSAGRYKPSTVERSKKYGYINLGELCEVIAGQSPKSEFYNENGVGLPFYQGKTHYGEKHLKEPTVRTSKTTKKSLKGDILMSVRAPVGPLNINPFEEICIGRGLAAIRKKDNRVLQDYLWYILKSFESDLSSQGNGGAVFNSINKKQIENFEIPLPPIEVQQKLVEKLNAQQNIIDSIDSLVTQLEEAGIDESIFDGIDDWVEFGDESVLQIIDGDRGKEYPKKTEMTNEGYCLFLSTKNVRHNGFLFDDLSFISKARDEKLRKGKLSHDDVIMTTRGTIGNVAYFDSNIKHEHIRINSGMVIFRTNKEKLLPTYLYYIIQSGMFQEKITGVVSGSAQPQLPIGTIRNITIPLPNIEKQKELTTTMENNHEIIKLLSKTKQKKEKSIKLILDKVFISHK